MTDVVVLPSALALLPSYAGRVDPLADVRRACLEALADLVEAHPAQVVVIGAGPGAGNASRGVEDPQSTRVARSLLTAVGFAGRVEEAVQPGPVPDHPDAGLVVVADGSACRGEKAPGHVDDRAFAFDEAIGAALATCDTEALVDLDDDLAAELLAAGVPALKALATVWGQGETKAEVDWSGDPFGVQYWVVRWTRGDGAR